MTLTRRDWRRALILMLLLGVLATVALLVRSLAPSARADAERARVPLPALAHGQFAYVPHPRTVAPWSSELLFFRTVDGQLRVFEVPTTQGRFALPDLDWWRPGPVCQDFGPDFDAGQIRCLDPQASTWVRDHLRWSLSGASLHPAVVHDMLVAPGHVEDGDWVVDR